MDLLSLVSKFDELVGFLALVLSGLIGIAMMIPGDQPEKSLQKVLDFLKKLSKK